MNRFDSLEVTVPRSSRSHTNDALPTRAYKQQDFSSHLEVPGQPSSPIVQRESPPSSDGSPPPGDATQREQVAYKAIQRLFSRASHLIRESSDLDGIIFVDASLQDLAVSENRPKSFATPANTPRFGGVPESTTGLFMGNKGNSTGDTEIINLPDFIRQGFKAQVVPNEPKTSHCQLLGYSLNTDSGKHGGGAPSDQHLNVSQSALRSLLRKYPNGNVFLFNSDGTLLDDKVVDLIARGKAADRSRFPSKDKSKFEKDKDQLRAFQLLDICPGARGIIFFPLWDPQRDQVSIAFSSSLFNLSLSPVRVGTVQYMLTFTESGLLAVSPGPRILQDSSSRRMPPSWLRLAAVSWRRSPRWMLLLLIVPSPTSFPPSVMNFDPPFMEFLQPLKFLPIQR